MRRGQLLSFDALLAVVIVIFVLGAVSATSDNLKSGITSLLGWYDRTSIPDTMLDVLLKSPGTPPNWSETLSTPSVPGLRAYSGQYVDYDKALAFFSLLKNNDSAVEDALLNLSLGHPFLLDFYLGRWEFRVNFSWNPSAGSGQPLTVSSLRGNYTYPQQLNSSQVWNRVAYLNGSFLVNPANVSKVFAAMNASSWVSYSERNTVMSIFKYNGTTWIAGNSTGIVFGGVLRYPVPNYAFLRFVVPNESGYLLIVVVDGGSLKVLGVWKTSRASNVAGEIWGLINGTLVPLAAYQGSSVVLAVPWGDVFTSPAGAGRPVLMYLYSNGFTLPVEMIDEGDLGVLMTPMYEPLLVKLWVWDGR